MQPISYARHQFPAEIIRHSTWLYLRFTLSYRDVEELLAERGIEISYESIRRWDLKFGLLFARNLRRLRPSPAAGGSWTKWWSRSRAIQRHLVSRRTLRTLRADAAQAWR
jgi:transposase-like protein